MGNLCFKSSRTKDSDNNGREDKSSRTNDSDNNGREDKSSRTKDIDNIDDYGREDRLSSLPDDILIDIISCLPLNTAIVTGALSRRWRHLWTKTTSVSLDSSKHDYFLRDYEFVTAIDSLLPQLTSPVIRKFMLLFREFPWDPREKKHYSVMESWLRLVCARNVEEIKVLCYCCDLEWSKLPAPPPCIFRTQSLVVLELGLGFGWHLPDDDHGANINLPNLKKLHIQIHMPVSSCDLSSKLIKYCPVLEDLQLHLSFAGKDEINLNNEPNIVDISSHNLKRLQLMRLYRAPRTTEFIIHTPKLEYFTVNVINPLRFYFVENPMGLLKADITVFWRWSSDSMSPMNELLGANCSVRSLVLKNFGLGCSTLFPNLTHLEYKISSSTHCEELIALLPCCPVLEVLDLDWFVRKELTWNPTHSAPACVLPHVKRINIEFMCYTYGFEKHWLNLVKFLLSSTPALRQIIFSVTFLGSGSEQVQKREELLLCKALYECPRSSSSCHVKFSGIYVKV